MPRRKKKSHCTYETLLKRKRERNRLERAKLTDEEREAERKRDREAHRLRRQEETAEEREARRKRLAEGRRLKRLKEFLYSTPQEYLQSLERRREQRKCNWNRQTPEEKEAKRQKVLERRRKKRQEMKEKEDEEEMGIKREKSRMFTIFSKFCPETEEERKERLARDREEKIQIQFQKIEEAKQKYLERQGKPRKQKQRPKWQQSQRPKRKNTKCSYKHILGFESVECMNEEGEEIMREGLFLPNSQTEETSTIGPPPSPNIRSLIDEKIKMEWEEEEGALHFEYAFGPPTNWEEEDESLDYDANEEDESYMKMQEGESVDEWSERVRNYEREGPNHIQSSNIGSHQMKGVEEEGGGSRAEEAPPVDEEGGGCSAEEAPPVEEEVGCSRAEEAPPVDEEGGGSREEEAPPVEEEVGCSRAEEAPPVDEEGGGCRAEVTPPAPRSSTRIKVKNNLNPMKLDGEYWLNPPPPPPRTPSSSRRNLYPSQLANKTLSALSLGYETREERIKRLGQELERKKDYMSQVIAKKLGVEAAQKFHELISQPPQKKATFSHPPRSSEGAVRVQKPRRKNRPRLSDLSQKEREQFIKKKKVKTEAEEVIEQGKAVAAGSMEFDEMMRDIGNEDYQDEKDESSEGWTPIATFEIDQLIQNAALEHPQIIGESDSFTNHFLVNGQEQIGQLDKHHSSIRQHSQISLDNSPPLDSNPHNQSTTPQSQRQKVVNAKIAHTSQEETSNPPTCQDSLNTLSAEFEIIKESCAKSQEKRANEATETSVEVSEKEATALFISVLSSDARMC